jgi:hypothetical protein
MLFIFVIIHMFSLQVVVGFPLTSKSRGWFHKDLQPGPAPYWAPGHALKLWLHSTHNRRRNKTCGQTVSPLEGLIDSPHLLDILYQVVPPFSSCRYEAIGQKPGGHPQQSNNN